ncbi:MAG: hypothetical protein M1822_001514 [Bathelium mastoideum]|nr:MAG: hypothetical protein M1822_001514 [Bathelium mastoideum]
MGTKAGSGKIYVVEHLDHELEAWSALEYATIANECHEVGTRFILSSVSPSLQLPCTLIRNPGVEIEQQSVETLFVKDLSRICLLDPSAQKELNPEDAQMFDVFLFGGILGIQSFPIWQDTSWGADSIIEAMIPHEARRCFPNRARAMLTDVDRTSELRKKGFEGRRLGPVQMTTDTAVRATRLVIQDQSTSRNHRWQWRF